MHFLKSKNNFLPVKGMKKHPENHNISDSAESVSRTVRIAVNLNPDLLTVDHHGTRD